MSVTIKIGDIERTMAGIKDLDKRTIQRMAQFAFDESQRGAGRHNKTGALFQSLYNRSVTNGRAVGHDPQRANHAQYVLVKELVGQTGGDETVISSRVFENLDGLNERVARCKKMLTPLRPARGVAWSGFRPLPKILDCSLP